MFADDINVLISDSDKRLLQIKIDRVVAELETWFNRNDLMINTGKAGVMLFHNRQTHVLVKPLVTFNNMNVDYTAEIKFCGIQITDTLKWHSPVQLLAGKLCKGKAVPLQDWTGPEGSRKLRFPDFVTTAQDGGKVGKLCNVAFIIKSLKGVLSLNLIRNIYFTKCHSILGFGILFWGEQGVN